MFRNPNVEVREEVELTVAAKSQSLAHTTNLDSPTFVLAQGYNRFQGIAHVADLLTTKALTVTLLQATDTAGTGAKVLGTAATHTASGTESLVAIADEHETALDTENSFLYVGVRVSHSNTAGALTVGTILGMVPNYKPASNN